MLLIQEIEQIKAAQNKNDNLKQRNISISYSYTCIFEHIFKVSKEEKEAFNLKIKNKIQKRKVNYSIIFPKVSLKRKQIEVMKHHLKRKFKKKRKEKRKKKLKPKSNKY